MPYFIFMFNGLIFMFPIVKYIKKNATKNTPLRIALDLILILLFIISIFALINSSYNPFIYFRF